MTLDELIERVERATGPDREIDVGISDHIGFYITPFTGADPQAWLTRISGKWVPCDREGRGYLNSSDRYCPRYTESLDAIVGLIEAKFGPRKWTIDSVALDLYQATVWNNVTAAEGGEHSDSAPLALCAAFLKALRALQQKEPGK